MPRLLIFAPFRQVIVDQASNNLSMIALLEQITVSRSIGEELSPDAQVPIDWALITVWLRQPGEEGRTFEQRVTVFRPDGTNGEPALTAFTMTHRTNRLPGQAFGMPAAAGTYRIQLELRLAAEGEEWDTVAEYPFDVLHTAPDAPR